MSNVVPFPTLPPLPIDPDLAALDFSPVANIRECPQEQRDARTRNLSLRVHNAAGAALALLGMTKPELIELMRTQDGRGLLGELDAAVLDAETLGGFISTASNRVAVAVACIEDDGGEAA
jgi:hypothetical protein